LCSRACYRARVAFAFCERISPSGWGRGAVTERPHRCCSSPAHSSPEATAIGPPPFNMGYDYEDDFALTFRCGLRCNRCNRASRITGARRGRASVVLVRKRDGRRRQLLFRDARTVSGVDSGRKRLLPAERSGKRDGKHSRAKGETHRALKPSHIQMLSPPRIAYPRRRVFLRWIGVYF